MAVETSYTSLRDNLSSVLDRVVDDHEVVIVRRRAQGRDVALISADDLTSLLETTYLLQSPANAKRLVDALARANRRTEKPSTVEQLKKELGLGKPSRRP